VLTGGPLADAAAALARPEGAASIPLIEGAEVPPLSSSDEVEEFFELPEFLRLLLDENIEESMLLEFCDVFPVCGR
jgi:hypothetical protein